MTSNNDIDRYIDAFSPSAFDTDYHIFDWSDEADPVVALSRHERDEETNNSIVVGVIKVKTPTKNDAFRANRHFESFIAAHNAVAPIDYFWKRYKNVIELAKHAKSLIEGNETEKAKKLLNDIINFEQP